EQAPPARSGGLDPARVDAAGKPERLVDLEHRGRLPATVALGAKMVDAPELPPDPRRPGVIRRPVPPAVEALHLDLLRPGIGAYDYPLPQQDQREPEDRGEHRDRGGQSQRPDAQSEQGRQLPAARE